MKEDDRTTAALTAIEAEMRKMLASQEDPYAAGWKIWEIAMSQAAASPDLMHPLWLIWGALTDWVENKPEAKSLAGDEMRRACREWLSLDRENTGARTVYLDRWVYKEMGYERKAKS